MIRETLNANARNAFMMLIPDSGVFMQSRATQGGATARLTGRAGAAPVWLRLVRQGNQFTGYLSSNGTSWTTAGTVTINMTAAAYVGPGGHEPRRLGTLDCDVHQSSVQLGIGLGIGHHHAPRAMDQP